MENDKFQEFMVDQFAKMFQNTEKVSSELQIALSGVKDNQLRIENRLNKDLDKILEFTNTQKVINKDIIEKLDRIECKLPKTYSIC